MSEKTKILDHIVQQLEGRHYSASISAGLLLYAYSKGVIILYPGDNYIDFGIQTEQRAKIEHLAVGFPLLVQHGIFEQCNLFTELLPHRTFSFVDKNDHYVSQGICFFIEDYVKATKEVLKQQGYEAGNE